MGIWPFSGGGGGGGDLKKNNDIVVASDRAALRVSVMHWRLEV